MQRLAANLTMMFNEVAFLQRFEAAAIAGFTGVEYAFPYSVDAGEIKAELQRHGLVQALFNMPPGDWNSGERGLAALPGREQEFLAGVELALSYARATGCTRLHAMAGVTATLAPDVGDACEDVYVENLRRAADRVAPFDIDVLIEPINLRDMPGYFMHTTTHAVSVLERVDRPNVKLQLDLYHCAISEGDVAIRIRDLAGRFAHVQIAGVPDRHEPDTGEIHYPYLLDVLDQVGYDGWVGAEYRPAAGTVAGLAWAQPWLRRA